jgi:hypothetical protein
LRRFAWLAPPMTSLSEKSLIVFYSGDVIIPLIAIAFFAIAMLQIVRRPPALVETAPVAAVEFRAAWAALVVVALHLGAGCVWARLGPAMTGDEFTRRIRGRIESEYWCVRFVAINPHNPKAPVWVMPSYAGPAVAARPINAFTIGIGWTFIWTVAASAMALRMRETAR